MLCAQAASRGFHSVGASPASKKERRDNEPGALLVNARAEFPARRIEGAQTMRSRATSSEGTNLVPKTNLVPIGDERDEALAFSAIVIPFSAGELAKAAKRSKEAAKGWKEGRSLPSAWSLMNMAQQIPAVRNYMLARLGVGVRGQGINSPQGMNALAEAIVHLADMPGPDGDKLRALLAQGGRRPRP